MNFVRTTIGIWILLFFLFLPFHYSVLPNFGEGLSNLLFPIVRSIGFVFGQELTQVNFHSDSIQLYLQLLTTLLFSSIISAGLTRIKSLKEEKLRTFLYTASSYILAFFLLKYGFDKVFKYQFYDAAPNTLFTPVGYLTKDILFWTSMGSSHSYNVFMGLIEIIPGLLLLWNKTRMIGAVIALGVLTNVLAINLGFDITVKILSTMLVITSLYILERHAKRLWAFFIQNAFVRPQLEENLINKAVLKRAVKGLVVALILIETAFTYLSAESWNGDNLSKIAYYGSYEVNHIGGSSNVFKLDQIKRIHIHDKGYLILEDHDGHFNDFKATVSSGSNVIKIEEAGIIFNVLEDKNGLSFISNSTGNQFRLTTKQIDIKKLPYNSDSFHWTVESFATE